jgi:hypothetical protein
MRKFVGANGFEFRAGQTAHEADLMDASIVVGAAASVAEDVGAFVIVARHLEQCLKVDAIHDRGFDVCSWKRYESRKKAVQFFFDIVANFFCFVVVEDGVFGIARTKDTTIGEFGEVDFDREAANETVVWQLRTVDADVLLFFGNFVNDDVGDLADFVTADAAFVGDGSRTQVPCANECEQGQPEFLMLSH